VPELQQSPLYEYRLAGKSLAEWHTYLTTDPATGQPVGHLRAASCQYGRCANSAAWWAIAAHSAYAYATGQAWDDAQTADSINYFMGLAVNDDPSVCELVREFRPVLTPDLVDNLDWDRTELQSY
jgi:hypothetical protein